MTATRITVQAESCDDLARRDDSRLCPVARTLGWLCRPDVDIRVRKASVQFCLAVDASGGKLRSRYVTRKLPENVKQAIRSFDAGKPFPFPVSFLLRIPDEFKRTRESG